MAKANNSPTNWTTELTIGDKTNLLGVFDGFRKLPALHKTDTQEIADRLDKYFDLCTTNAILPTVEAMALVLGVSRMAMWKWQQEDCEAGRLISRAKEVINATIATATLAGKANPVYSIWLQKNHFAYTDTQVLQLDNVTDKRPLTAAELPRLGEWKASQTAEDLPRLEQENLASDYTIMENSMENTKDNT